MLFFTIEIFYQCEFFLRCRSSSTPFFRSVIVPTGGSFHKKLAVFQLAPRGDFVSLFHGGEYQPIICFNFEIVRFLFRDDSFCVSTKFSSNGSLIGSRFLSIRLPGTFSQKRIVFFGVSHFLSLFSLSLSLSCSVLLFLCRVAFLVCSSLNFGQFFSWKFFGMSDKAYSRCLIPICAHVSYCYSKRSLLVSFYG